MNYSINFFKILFSLVLFSGLYSCTDRTPYPYEFMYKDLPFEMLRVTLPVFPDREISITDMGAVGDGITDNTQAFENAMVKLAEQGGGRLRVPAGIWYTGPVVFRSNINLHLEKGALLLFSENMDDYPLVETVFEGLDTRRCQSPVSGRNLENIAITGEGAINGSGHVWRPVKKQKVTDGQWRKITSRGGVYKRADYWFPTAKGLHGDTVSDMNVPRHLTTEAEWLALKDFLRPVMISFIECKNVWLQGVLFENSPSWNVHPLMCENVIIDNVFIRNPSYAQNGDGLDIESCKNVLVVNSLFDVGDDGICIKSGKDEDGRIRARPTENVLIENCKVFQGHGGFVVGSEMSGGVRNIVLNNCEFLGTDVGLRFKSNRGRGGVVENIYINNVTMLDIVTDSFSFNLFYGGKSAVEDLEDAEAGKTGKPVPAIPPVTEETPAFRNIFVKNLVSRNARTAMTFRGLPEMNISNIQMENATITSRYGAVLHDCDGVVFKNVTIVPQEGEVIEKVNVKNFREE